MPLVPLTLLVRKFNRSSAPGLPLGLLWGPAFSLINEPSNLVVNGILGKPRQVLGRKHEGGPQPTEICANTCDH